VYETWITENVVPAIYADCGGVRTSSRRAPAPGVPPRQPSRSSARTLFPLAIGLSRQLRPHHVGGWGEQGEQTYFNNPMAYVANLDGDHLEWLRSRVSLVLVVGQGAWEVDPTKALPSTGSSRPCCARRASRTSSTWGFDVPHDWPSWQRQFAHHLPRFS
jgi:hypothetical protein